MRKMLFICMGLGFLVTSIATASDVVSTNIVGYLKTTATGKYFTSGPTFVQVQTFLDPANPQWCLGDLIGKGMSPSDDYIQFLNPTNAFVRLQASYLDPELLVGSGIEELAGWWKTEALNNSDFDPQNKLDSRLFPISEGFLCYFESSGVDLVYAGEVLVSSQKITFSNKYPLIVNFLPVDLVLGDLKCTGMSPSDDYIQFLNPANAFVKLQASYLDPELLIGSGIEELAGWWKTEALNNSDFDPQNRLDNEPLPAGAAVLGYFESPSVSIIFPNPLDL